MGVISIKPTDPKNVFELSTYKKHLESCLATDR